MLMLLNELRNNIPLFVGIVVGALLLVVGIIMFFIFLPKIKEKMAASKQRKLEEKQRKQDLYEKQKAADASVFKSRDELAEREKNMQTAQQNSKDILAVLNHERVAADEDLKAKKFTNEKNVKNDNVLNILGGNIAAAQQEGVKKESTIAEEYVDENEEKVKMEKTKDVMSILNGGVPSDKNHNKGKKRKKVEVVKVEGDDNKASGVFDVLGGKHTDKK